ncbi:MAG: ABC transporter substrate-binding protein [Holosporales bacterium]|nr:ABC transporter substrate-binding protein [Holosporales bacterium]
MAAELYIKLYICVLLSAVLFVLSGCKNSTNQNALKFAVCADYPPFEYYENGKIVGFDADLANAIAEKLGKKAVLEDMQLPAILASVHNGLSDAAISALAATKERANNYDFSTSYYEESFSAVYKENHPVATLSQLSEAKVVCQLGSSMEIWLKSNNIPHNTIDNNNQAIESLKAGHVDCVFMDEIQARAFCKNNPGLQNSHIAKSGDGYSILVKKGSSLKKDIDGALKELEADGTIEKLKKKYLE